MSEAFQKHVDKRINEIHERMRIYKLKNKTEMKIFETAHRKGGENINKIKPNR